MTERSIVAVQHTLSCGDHPTGIHTGGDFGVHCYIYEARLSEMEEINNSE